VWDHANLVRWLSVVAACGLHEGFDTWRGSCRVVGVCTPRMHAGPVSGDEKSFAEAAVLLVWVHEPQQQRS
jgi:hypothetical protein